MLWLYNTAHDDKRPLTNYSDLYVEQAIGNGTTPIILDKLHFTYPLEDDNCKLIDYECYVATEDAEYIVKEKNLQTSDGSSGTPTAVEYICDLNIEPFQGTLIDNFAPGNVLPEDAANLALAGTGWEVGYSDVSKVRAPAKKQCNVFDALSQIATTYACEITFDSLHKLVNIHVKQGADRGAYFAEQLNLKTLQVQGNSRDYVTRLYPIGKDGLTIASVNSGVNYVSNYQYSTKVISAYWINNDYTSATNLMADAIERLDYLSKPANAYSAEIVDLAKISDNWGLLDFQLGDWINLISQSVGTHEQQRIIKIDRYLEEPEKSTIEISNRIASLDDIILHVASAADTLSDATDSTGAIQGSNVQVSNGDGTYSTLNAAAANFGSLIATKAKITDLEAATADIGNLQSTKVDTTYLTANYITSDTIIATYATIDNLKATNLSVGNLSTQVGNIQTLVSGNITADNIKTNSLTADRLVAGTITADSAVIANAAIRTANIADAAITNAKIDRESVNKLVVTAADIANAAIGNAQIDRASVNKLVVTSADIANAAIQTANIADASITNAKIDRASVNKLVIGTADIADAAIGNAQIDRASVNRLVVTTADIANAAIGETQIADGSITNAKIVSLGVDKLLAGTIDARVIKVTHLDCADLTVGQINGQQIAPDSILLQHLSDEVTGDISNTALAAADAVQVGGRNLLLNTQPLINSSSVYAFRTYNLSQPLDYYLGKTITLSCKARTVSKGSGDNHVRIYLYNNEWSWTQYAETAANDTAWQIISITTTIPANLTSLYCCAYNYPNGNGGTVEIKEVQLETGNKVTDWEPAPEDLLSGIGKAQTTADGKNAVYYQSVQPTGGTYKLNDIWFDTDDGNKIYQYNGSTWVLQQLGTNAIANLSITNALIADATIDHAKIASVDAGKITAGFLSADRIAANSLDAGKLIAYSITATQISSNAITTEKIDAGAVTAGKIASYSITADKLLIGDASNVATVNEITGVNLSNTWTNTTISGGYIQNTVNGWFFLNPVSPLAGNPGDQYYVEMYGMSTTGSAITTNLVAGVWASNISGGWSSNTTGNPITFGTTETKITGYVNLPDYDPTTICYYSIGFGTINANAVKIRKVFIRRTTPGTIIQDGAISTYKIASRSIIADRIVAGAITATEIMSRTITATQIQANTITANEIKANTITATQIQANTITATELASRSITTDKLQIGDFTNYCTNPDFRDSLGLWTYCTRVADPGINSTAAPTAYVAKKNSRDSYEATFSVTPGDVYYCAITGIPSNAQYPLTIGLYFKKKDGSYITWTNCGKTIPITATSWTTISGVITIPVDAVTATVWVQDGVSSNYTDTGYWYFTNVIVQKQVPTMLIQDGAITANKINTTNLCAEKISTSNSPVYGTIGTTTINGNTYNGFVISNASGQFFSVNDVADDFLNNNVSTCHITSSRLLQIDSSTELLLGSQVCQSVVLQTQGFTGSGPTSISVNMNSTATIDATNSINQSDSNVTVSHDGVTLSYSANSTELSSIGVYSSQIEINAQELMITGSTPTYMGSLNAAATTISSTLSVAGNTTLSGTLNNYAICGVPGARWNVIPTVNSSGVMEIGEYIDFHASNTDTSDNSVRLAAGSGTLTCTGGFSCSALTCSSTLTVQTYITLGQGGSNTVLRNGYSGGSIYLESDGAIFCTNRADSAFVPIKASSFDVNSMETFKQDIVKFPVSGLDIVNLSDIYQYRLKDEVERGIINTKYGFVIGDSYRTPVEVLNNDGSAINQYSMAAINWKATQELSSKVDDNISEITMLRSQIIALQAQLDMLQSKIA